MLSRIRGLIRELLARRLAVPEIPFALERLRAIGFQPALIFDAGAYRGDFARSCLKVWPGCRVACFEALSACENDLRVLARERPTVRVHRCLLGAQTREEVLLNVSETGSSILSEHAPEDLPVQPCAMRTVDEIVAAEYSGCAPEFLKLDVQGYELEILKGAEQTLSRARAILLETNLLDIYRGVPLVAEVFGWLDARDWVAYDICGLIRRPLDRALWQADFIFVPRESPLRSDKRWNA